MTAGAGKGTGKKTDALDVLLQAARAAGREEFLFAVANRSVAAARYERASVWDLRGRRPRPLAASGGAALDAAGPYARMWGAALAGLSEPERGGILAAERFADETGYAAIAEKTGGLSAVWAAVPGSRAGILFERWGGETFNTAEAAELLRLAEGYGLLWNRTGRARADGAGRFRRWAMLAAGVAALAALVFVRVPLRVVASAEVTAATPRLVSAPMDGVIEEVRVAPGQRVEAGDVLAEYDSRLMEEELKISRRQVEVVEAELAGARARAFADPRSRGETAIFEARLEQELARVEALEIRFARRTVTSPIAGMVQLDNVRAWRGRPVATGQAVMWLVDPARTRVNLWLPQDDRIDFDLSKPIRIHLDALGGAAREAGLTYVSSFASATPDGGYAFPAEAEWLAGNDETEAPPLGLRGSAVIYGPEARLGYWLFRRPLAWLRRWFGI